MMRKVVRSPWDDRNLYPGNTVASISMSNARASGGVSLSWSAICGLGTFRCYLDVDMHLTTMIP